MKISFANVMYVDLGLAGILDDFESVFGSSFVPAESLDNYEPEDFNNPKHFEQVVNEVKKLNFNGDIIFYR